MGKLHLEIYYEENQCTKEWEEIMQLHLTELENKIILPNAMKEHYKNVIKRTIDICHMFGSKPVYDELYPTTMKLKNKIYEIDFISIEKYKDNLKNLIKLEQMLDHVIDTFNR